MSLYAKFENDPTLESEGVTLDLGDGSKFLLRRAGGSNLAYQKYIERLLKPHRRALRTGSLPLDLQREIAIKGYARHVVKSWEGVNDREGKPLECVEQNIIKLFTDLPDLFIVVQETAENEALYRAQLREEDLGN